MQFPGWIALFRSDNVFMEIDNFIDEKNKALYERLSAQVTILFEEDHTDKEWGVRKSAEGTYVISAPVTNPGGPENFTHELLHIELLLEGFYDNQDIIDSLTLVDPEWIACINNNFAHFKMLERFERLGYPRSKFLMVLPANPEVIFEEGLKEVEDDYTAKRMVDFLVQTTMEMNWIRTWLGWDVSAVEQKLHDLDEDIFFNVNERTDEWKKVSTPLQTNYGFIKQFQQIGGKLMPRHERP